MVRKSHLPCDSADAQDWVASRVLRLISGTDPQFKTAIGVIAYEVIPNGYATEARYLPVNYEWAAVAIDVDVNISTSSEDGCYDTCATGDIPLPDFEPCEPCLTSVAVDGVTITGNGTPADPLVAIGGGGGTLVALPFSTDHLTATGNAYAINDVVYYLGNVYRCIANNDSILPTNTTYWTNLGAGFPLVQQPSDWNATTGNNQILNKPTIPAAQVNSDWNAVSGVAEILNKPTIPVNLDDLADVNAPTPTNGQVLTYNNITSDWEAATPSGGGSGTVTSVGTTGLISGGPITTSGTITTSMNTAKLVGRYSAGTGIMEEITVGSGLTLTGAGVLNNTATPTPTGYYGAFQDNTTQTAALANTAYAVKLNTTDLTNGVSVVNDGSGNPTQITLANTGIYNIQFSLQLEKTGGSGNFTVDVWVRKNGVDIPNTTGKVVLTGSANASPVVAAWNYVLDLAANDYVQLMWSTSNNNSIILAAVATPPHPGIPSAILTVTQQAGIMAGTGITAINSLTGAAQSLVVGTGGTDFAVSSLGTTHTFNLPTASAANRGALSSGDWTTFNGKFNTPSGTTSQYVRGDGTLATFPTLPLVYKSAADTAGYQSTANTVLYTQLIPANTFAAGDIIRVSYRAKKLLTNGATTTRIYINSTANLSGSPIQVGILSGLAASRFVQMDRHLVIKNSSNATEVAISSSSLNSDTVNTGNFDTLVINWTNALYFVFAFQNASALDTNFGSMYLIEKL